MSSNTREEIIIEPEVHIMDDGDPHQAWDPDEILPLLEPLKKCGEVFLEGGTGLVFVCTLCSEHFNNLRLFGAHLTEIHINNKKADEAGLPKGEETMTIEINTSCDETYDALEQVDPSELEKCDMYVESSVGSSVATQESNSTYTCATCGASFERLQSYQYHIRNQHDRIEIISIAPDSAVCQYCDKVCEHGNLQDHIDTEHTGHKRFRCRYCNKCFKSRSILESHKNIHTGVRPYSCKYCSKSFTMPASLKVHLRIHLEEPRFHCATCGKSFHHNYERQRHEQVHSTVKPYHCNECGLNFRSNRYLLRHIHRHVAESGSNSKVYQCDVCDESFPLLGLYWHRKTHAKKT